MSHHARDRAAVGLRKVKARIGRLHVAVVLLGAFALSGMVGVLAAHGYSHLWSCQGGSGSQCYDFSGQRYNRWIQSSNEIQEIKSEVCAKAITAAGNVRSGSGCNGNSFGRISSYFPDPESQAYGYWGGSGNFQTNIGKANT